MKKFVTLLTLAASLAAGTAVRADSVVAIDLKTGRVGVAAAASAGVDWERLKGRALNNLGVRSDAGLQVYRVISRRPGHLSIATGRHRPHSGFSWFGNGGTWSTFLPRPTEALSERSALHNMRLRLTGRSNLPAFNERVKSWYDPGFAAR